MNNIFTRHPNKIGESYTKHLFRACSFGLQLIIIALKVFIHAIFPFLFENSTSKSIKKLHNVLEERRRASDSSKN